MTNEKNKVPPRRSFIDTAKQVAKVNIYYFSLLEISFQVRYDDSSAGETEAGESGVQDQFELCETC